MWLNCEVGEMIVADNSGFIHVAQIRSSVFSEAPRKLIGWTTVAVG
jgi:hypothetical protein